MATTNNIGYLIHHLASTLSRQTDQLLLTNLGVGFSQFKILMVLQNNSGAQQKQLAEGLGQTEASISRQIKNLQRDGFLTIMINPNNRREHLSTPTAKGIKVTERARELLNDHYRPMFNLLTPHQQEELQQTLGIMHDYACQGTGWCKIKQ